MNVQFINKTSTSSDPSSGHAHSHDGGSHSHEHGDHGHTHEHLEHPGEYRILPSLRPSLDQLLTWVGISGKYSERDLPDYSSRDFQERGFTVGIGGLVRPYPCGLGPRRLIP